MSGARSIYNRALLLCLLVVALFLSFFVGWSLPDGLSRDEGKQVIEDCKALEEGMSLEQVLNVMGRKGVIEKNSQEADVYDVYYDIGIVYFSYSPRLSFDYETNILTNITCGFYN